MATENILMKLVGDFHGISFASAMPNSKISIYGETMIIEEIMSKDVVSVEMDDSLKDVKNIFDNTNFHHLLVVEIERLVGITSDRDLLKSLSPNIGTTTKTVKDFATLNKKPHQIMSRKPVTLFASSSIYEAIEIFNKNILSCIPIVAKDNKPVGILSWHDMTY